MRLVSPLLLGTFALQVSAADISLSLEQATRIARERITNDGLPADHLVIHVVDSPLFHDPFYVVWFDPQIPDLSSMKDGQFVGYDVKMDGTVEKTVITETVERVQAKLSDSSTTLLTPPKLASALLNKPFTLQLRTTNP